MEKPECLEASLASNRIRIFFHGFSAKMFFPRSETSRNHERKQSRRFHYTSFPREEEPDE